MGDNEFDQGREALERLAAARIAVLDMTSGGFARLSQIQLTQYKDALRSAKSPRQRLSVGAVWALRLAQSASSPQELDSALFRFAQHLRASVNSRETPPQGRGALSAAAMRAFERLRNTPSEYRTNRPPVAPASGWEQVLGLDCDDWTETLATVGVAIRSPRRGRGGGHFAPVPLPGWLNLAAHQDASSRLLQVSPWTATSPASAEELAAAVGAAYQAIVNGDVGTAAEALRPAEESIGQSWVPTDTPEGRRAYAFLRAVPLLDAALSGDQPAVPHCVLSAIELLERVQDDQLVAVLDSLFDRFLTGPSGDHAADLDWAVLRYRLCRALGHEAALVDLDNPTKAELRSLWRQAHREQGPTVDTTVEIIRALDAELGAALTELLASSGQPGPASEDAFESLERFCDQAERDALTAVSAAVRSHLDGASAPASMQQLHDTADLVQAAIEEVRNTNSLLLHESSLPFLGRLAEMVSNSIRSLRSEGGPELSLHLHSDRLPLLSPAPTDLEIEVLVRNDGTIAARGVEVVVDNASDLLALSVDSRAIGDIPAGGERTTSFSATTTSLASAVSFAAVATWSDDYDREGDCRAEFYAEAEREANWTPKDRNPFRLNSIEEPERLIGREEWIREFLDIARSGGSMYITGLKRVGKTSLARVALKLLARARV